MDRRSFLQASGLGAAAVVMGKSVLAMAADTPPEKVVRVLRRSEVALADTWDLTTLFADDNAWNEAFAAWQEKRDGYEAFRGKLGGSAEMLVKCIQFDLEVSETGERLGVYAQLKTTEDQANGDYQRMQGRFAQAASLMEQAGSFIHPEILSIPPATMEAFLKTPGLAPYRLLIDRLLRFKPHTLGEAEEKLLAMQSEMAHSPVLIFRQLNDADLKFGKLKNEKGVEVELSHASYASFLESPDVEVRRNAFKQYYSQYKAHQNTLAATLKAAIERDIFLSKAKKYSSALESALFPDNVPIAVYDNLIASVHRQLPALHRYYDVRRRKMKLQEIHHYDTYAPIVPEFKSHHVWDEAVEVIMNGLQPLGDEYCKVLGGGLRGRWCDRYENIGKQSGAFSMNCYNCDPFILISYKPDVLDDVFTLAHEGGHSMHSYYSGKTQPYAYYDYTLFVAEVASTFNEVLLGEYLLKNAKSDRERAYLLNMQIDTMRGTIYRQTMFAEFEKLAHESAEAGEPATLDRLKTIYHGLLEKYFGPNFTLDPELDIECLRVPHFYRTFYVYKYATGMSAALALADRVLHGGKKELNEYLGFLKGGCSKDPLDLLRDAGVDMEKPASVDLALTRFDKMVKELDTLI